MKLDAPLRPGDVVVRRFKNGGEHRWVVLDPPLTPRGKVRLRTLDNGRPVPSGADHTAWWRYDLPAGYEVVRCGSGS